MTKGKRALFVAALVVALVGVAATALALPLATLSMYRPVASAVVAADTMFVVSGTMKPVHTLTTTPTTRIYLYRYHRGAWRRYASKLATNRNVNVAYTSFTTNARLPYNGSWMVRAYHADAGHAASWAPARYFTVTGPNKPMPTGGTGTCWLA